MCFIFSSFAADGLRSRGLGANDRNMGTPRDSECDAQHTRGRINVAVPISVESFPAIHAGFTDAGGTGGVETRSYKHG
jgi:hypothetical protein